MTDGYFSFRPRLILSNTSLGSYIINLKYYCPPGSNAYEDAPQRIGFSATISAPHMSVMRAVLSSEGSVKLG